ncbi:hypothetical protein ABOM_000051 [Aspergillus bombycis]|uniref:Uncharacterized protein n=1 Tax=Aspergillus bombycis TaxID=109264 RepID=A0A1F8AGW7_9EURO|nr:hypothetical protein ABOM_000051 [Aspergillus bombycis]OGM50993.1 hypothetical protein ABOM_000051 [Aspergillus bombycis]
MSLEELESLIRDSDNAIEDLKKGKISIAYGSMTMEDVEMLFRIPKTPVFMDIPFWEIPIPTTMVEDLKDLDFVTEGSLKNEALSSVRINIILQAVLRERRLVAPPSSQNYAPGVRDSNEHRAFANGRSEW